MNQTQAAVQFQPGQTYQTASLCDSECIYRVRVIKRTAKSVVVDLSACARGSAEVRRIKTDDRGVEFINPFGVYSMSPRIRADRTSAS